MGLKKSIFLGGTLPNKKFFTDPDNSKSSLLAFLRKKSDNSIAISEREEEIVRFVNSNTHKHLSATKKLIAIRQALGDITDTIDCEIWREIVDARTILVDDLVAAVDEGQIAVRRAEAAHLRGGDRLRGFVRAEARRSIQPGRPMGRLVGLAG